MSKTVKIAALIEDINRRNKLSICLPEVRQGWNAFLEHVLHITNNYKGFGYLEENEVPAGQKPGVIRGEPNQFPDETRRFYYVN